MNIIRTSSLILMTLLALCSINTSFAKSINMYDQPADNAKLVGALNSEHGIITIFTPKDSKWTKVADPRNGNVGWIKSSDIDHRSFNFHVITGENGNHRYQIYQYGNMPIQTSAQIEHEIKTMKFRQQVIQHDMQHMMNEMFNMVYAGPPMFIPVFVTPDHHHQRPQQAVTTQTSKPAQSSTTPK